MSGTADLKTNILKLWTEHSEEVDIRRTKDNERRRPNAMARHDPFSTERTSDLNFMSLIH